MLSIGSLGQAEFCKSALPQAFCRRTDLCGGRRMRRCVTLFQGFLFSLKQGRLYLSLNITPLLSPHVSRHQSRLGVFLCSPWFSGPWAIRILISCSWRSFMHHKMYLTSIKPIVKQLNFIYSNSQEDTQGSWRRFVATVHQKWQAKSEVWCHQ